MMYLGDIAEDQVLYFGWHSSDADGASITRATDGTIQVYKDDGTTQSTAGITDTEDFDSLTGVHWVKIDTSADAFYAAGHDYTVVLSGATIDGQSVNAVLAAFSIENRVAGALGAQAKLDANAEADTAISDAALATAANLATVDGVVDAIQAVTDNIPDSGALTSLLADIASILADTNELQTDDYPTTLAAILTDTGTTLDGKLDAIQAVTDNLPDSGALTTLLSNVAAILTDTGTTLDGKIDAIQAVTDNIPDSGALTTLLSNISAILADTNELQTDDYPTSLTAIADAIAGLNDPTAAAIADAVWEEAQADHVSAGSFGEIATEIASILTDTGTTLDGKLDAIQAVTDNLPDSGALTTLLSNVASILSDTGTDGVVIAAATMTSIADALLKRDMSAVSGEADRSPLNAFRALRNKWSISGGTLTVTKEDDATAAWTGAVTTAAGDPVSEIDPA